MFKGERERKVSNKLSVSASTTKFLERTKALLFSLFLISWKSGWQNYIAGFWQKQP